MPNIQGMCAEARLRCDEPLPQKPSMRRILLGVVDATQNLYSRLENTGQTWSLKPDYQLVVQNGVSDYLLAIDESYGKAIQVLTFWPGSQIYIQRYVNFVEFSDLNFNWPYPVNLASWLWNDGSNCTAMRMAFYYKDDGTRWVRVLPQPALQASYLITFASGDWTTGASLDTSPVLNQFHSLVEIWASQSILPSCQWNDDQNYNRLHRQELMVALKNDEQRIGDEFDRYVRNLIQDHMGNRTSSLDSEDMGIGYGGGWW